MLSTAGLAVLDVLVDRPDATPDELVDETAHSREHVYRVLDSLRDDGLVVESREQHNRRRVRLAETPVTEAYRRLATELGHVPWPEVLSPATLRVCWYLDEPRRVATIAERLGVSRQAVHRTLAPLKGRAMLSPSGPEYALTEGMEPLFAFARAVATHEHRRRVRRVAPTATVEWCDPKRTLARVQRPGDADALDADEDWEPTGLARFEEHGLEFGLAGEPAFWYDPLGDPSAADVVCHTLVVEADARRVSYAMLLVEAASIGRESLGEVAAWYGLESEIASLCEAIDGEFDPDADVALPSSTEYEVLKLQYGIA